MKRKQKVIRQIEAVLMAGLVIVLLCVGYKCKGQEIRFNTSPGLLIVTETNNPDALCLHLGDDVQELTTANLQYSGNTVLARFLSMIEMSIDATGTYRNFLESGNFQDNNTTRAYFKKCQQVREQLLKIIKPETITELQQYTNKK